MSVSLAWIVYRSLASLAVRCLLGPFWWLSGRGAELGERLGREMPPAWSEGRLLVHAVSVGEVGVAHALLEELRVAAPDLGFLLTCGTRDGRRVAERMALRPGIGVEAVTYLPWDRPAAVKGWLARVAPRGVVVVETEIWPGLHRACRELGIPLVIVNGRFHGGDVRRYRLALPFFRDVLAGVSWIGAQDEEEGAGFAAIGAPPSRVVVTGSLKFDVPVLPGELPSGWPVRGSDPVVVAGSTHPPEERWLLSALLVLRETIPGLRLVLAPRRIARAGAVVADATRLGLAATVSSAGPRASWDVLVLDELGLLAPLYAEADAVFVGGSLVPRGGQNPIEAAARGRAAVMGPHVESFRSVVRQLEGAGGLVRLRGREPVPELAEALGAFLRDPALAKRAGEAARRAAGAGRGAARLSAAAVLEAVYGAAGSRAGSRRPRPPLPA